MRRDPANFGGCAMRSARAETLVRPELAYDMVTFHISIRQLLLPNIYALMAKRKKQKRRADRRVRKQHQHQVQQQKGERIKSITLLLSSSIAAVSLLSALISLYGYYSTRLTVTPSSTIDQLNIFSTPFVVTNNGQLAVKGVKFSCTFDRIQFQNGSEVRDSSIDIQSVNTIEPDHPITLLCDQLYKVQMPVRRADISITITYRPFLSYWDKNQQYRFFVVQGTDGTLRWLPQSNS